MSKFIYHGRSSGKALAIVVAVLVFILLIAAGGYYLVTKMDISNLEGFSNLGSIAAPPDKAEFKEAAPEVFKETTKWGMIPLNQMVVVLKDDQKSDVAKDIATLLSGQIVGEFSYINLYQIEFAPMEEEAFNLKLGEIQAQAGVETAFPNALVVGLDLKGKPCSPLNDPIFDDPENRRAYEVIGMAEAWRMIKASKVMLNPVQVGVLDESMYSGSDEQGGKVKIEGDFTQTPAKNNAGVVKNGGLTHGTLVTHVIGANAENGGATGIASIMGDKLTIKVKNLFDGNDSFIPKTAAHDEDTVGTYTNGDSYAVKALIYLKEQVKSGAKVINCSFGPGRGPSPDNQWINAAYTKFFAKMAVDHPDVVFVAAAGNEGDAARTKGGVTATNCYPAGIPAPNLITVGSLVNDGSKSSFSNFVSGDGEVTVSAVGSDVVMGVDKDGKPIKNSGTSFSAPQVTATIALLQSINPNLTASELKALIQKSAMPGTPGEKESTPIPEGMGAGLLRVDQAVLMAINGLREKEGKEPLTADFLLNLSKVELTAKGGGKKFVVKAILPEVVDGKTGVAISVSGQHIMVGDTIQQVGSNEEASWEIELVDKSVFVKVVRQDSETCATMNLMELDYSGNWDVMLTITEDTLIKAISEALAAMFDSMAEENGCEKTENGEYKIVGSENATILTITKLDEAGSRYTINSAPKDPEANGIDLSEFINGAEGEIDDQGQLVFNVVRQEDDGSLYLDLILALEDEKGIKGSFKLYLKGSFEGMNLTEELYTLGTIKGLKMEQ